MIGKRKRWPDAAIRVCPMAQSVGVMYVARCPRCCELRKWLETKLARNSEAAAQKQSRAAELRTVGPAVRAVFPRRTTGMPDRGKGRTDDQQRGLDQARAAIFAAKAK